MADKKKRNTAPAIDLGELGRRLRAARVLGDFESAEAVTRRMNDLGFDINPQRLYYYERGEFTIPLDLAIGLAVVLDPPGGLEFFRPAFRADLWEKLQALARSHQEGPAAPESDSPVV